MSGLRPAALPPRCPRNFPPNRARVNNSRELRSSVTVQVERPKFDARGAMAKLTAGCSRTRLLNLGAFVSKWASKWSSRIHHGARGCF